MSRTWTIESYWYNTVSAGETFSLNMLVWFSTSPNLVSAFLDGVDVCEGGSTEMTTEDESTETTTTTGIPTSVW